MNRDDVELLREIQKNTEMGLHALEVIGTKVYDDHMALQLTRESFRYGAICDRAKAELLSCKQMPEPENKAARMMLTASIHGNTLFNATTSHLAELLIRGSNMGISSLWKAMNHNGKAGEQAAGLAHELLDFEESNIKELKKYL